MFYCNEAGNYYESANIKSEFKHKGWSKTSSRTKPESYWCAIDQELHCT